MKRFLILLLAVMLIVSPGLADERNLGTKCGDFWYDLNDDGIAKLTACFSAAQTMELPAELDGYPLTVIGYLAFIDYSPVNIIIPEGVIELQYCAFRDNHMTESVALPNSLTVIDGNPFVNCSALISIKVPEEHPVFEITDGVLMNRAECRVICPADFTAETVKIPLSATSIGNGAFYCNEKVRQIRLHDNIVAIGDAAFAGCTALAGIVIPPSVTYIGENAQDGVKLVGVFHDSYGEEYCLQNGIEFEYFEQ